MAILANLVSSISLTLASQKITRQAIFFTIKRFSGRLSYYHNNGGNEPLRQITVGQLLDNAAAKWPDQLAIESVHENIQLTYAEAQNEANKLGAGFLKLGLKPGDRIVALGASTIHWYITMQAAAKAGLILAGINPASSIDELQYCMVKAGAKAIVADYSFRNSNYHDMLLKIAPEIKNTPPSSKLKSTHLPDLEYIIIATDLNLPATYKYKDILSSEKDLNALHEISAKIQSDDPFILQYTSGTTGFPKAATLTHFSVYNNGYFFGKRLGLSEKTQKICLQVPLFHVFGTGLGVIAATCHGSSLIIPSPWFNKDETIKTLKKQKLNVIYGTPTMFIDLCAQIRKIIESNESKNLNNYFDAVVSGGALCPPVLFEEISSTLNCKNIMVKVVDADGRMVPFGSPGEVWFRGYATMLGYWNDEEETNKAITKSRWMKSGDLMILNENGYGRIIGRCKDIIIRGGENIAPGEVEELILTHENILEVQAYGVEDKRLGEEICVSIKLKPNTHMTENDVIEYCKGKISYYKIPKYVKFVQEFPKTASGKVNRRVLREMMNKELSV